jgi:hypothetical protein
MKDVSAMVGKYPIPNVVASLRAGGFDTTSPALAPGAGVAKNAQVYSTTGSHR